MGTRVKLFGFSVFLLLILSFCQANNATVKIVGSIHCADCIKRELSNSQASLGVNVVISCKSNKTETKTQGHSAINKEGKFNVTLSTYSIDGCFAKLQTASSAAPCPIHTPQTATVELLSADGNATETAKNKPTVIKFSPLTCQSAFFWPFHNITFFPSAPPPPVEYAIPPSEVLAPVQPPTPPVEDLTPPPAPVPTLPPTFSAPAPEIGTPQPSPPLESGTPPPASTPVYNTPPPQLSPQAPPLNMPIPPPNPKFQKPIPPPLPISNKPPPILPPIPKFQKPSPILPPIPPKKHKTPKIRAPIAPPIPAPSEAPNSPPPLPQHETAAPPPSPTEISTPPSERKPSSIPRAPPVPRLPPTPQVPRKYFNAPKSKSKPPHSF